MTYRLVFDISQQPYSWDVWVIFLVLLATGVRLVVKPDSTAKRLAKPAGYVRGFGTISLFILLAIAVPPLVQTLSEYTYYHSLVSTGNYAVVEGEVADFSPMPYAGHANEVFVVNGVKFQYSDYNIMPGFNNTSSHGGPIREGLRVRITYAPRVHSPQDNAILRLEIGN